MHAGSRTATAQALEDFLGDPRREDSRISFHQSLRLDEAEAFPESALAALDDFGLPRFYVPAGCGGALQSFEVLTALVRCVARRDLTVAIAHAKTFLGAGPIWIAGSAAQKQQLGAAISAGARVALGLTEEAHGGDLFATETTAEAGPCGYVISGEKWLINNATRGDALTVLARTDSRGGPRGFSLFYCDKRDLCGYQHLPKIATHGIRGADISGIRFERCAVPGSARIGELGQGLEIIMKSLQVSRVLVPALSLGALDAGLRQVLAFARSRRIGSGHVAQLPHARRILIESFIELLIADAVVRCGARSIHVLPERLAVHSAVVKYLVPSRVDAALHRLAVLLGARHYLRGSPFEKLLRDHALVALFDGSTVVNLSALAQELPRLYRLPTRPQSDAELFARSAALYDFAQPLPDFAPQRLELMNRGGEDGPRLLAQAQDELARLPSAELAPELRAYLALLMAQARTELLATAGSVPAKVHSLAQSPESFTAAERFAQLHAACTCALVWLRNRQALGEFFQSGEWLALALFQLLSPRAAAPAAAWYERAAAQLFALDDADRSFALEPLNLNSEHSRS